MPDAPNAVRELAEDATSRKRFLRQAGGGGVAASLALFVAACGGDDSSSSSSKAKATGTAMAASGTEQFGTVEGRHAAVLNLATNAKPAPGAFAKPATAAEVLKSVKPFLAT